MNKSGIGTDGAWISSDNLIIPGIGYVTGLVFNGNFSGDLIEYIPITHYEQSAQKKHQASRSEKRLDSPPSNPAHNLLNIVIGGAEAAYGQHLLREGLKEEKDASVTLTDTRTGEQTTHAYTKRQDAFLRATSLGIGAFLIGHGAYTAIDNVIRAATGEQHNLQSSFAALRDAAAEKIRS